jgi:hypothetical protein
MVLGQNKARAVSKRDVACPGFLDTGPRWLTSTVRLGYAWRHMRVRAKLVVVAALVAGLIGTTAAWGEDDPEPAAGEPAPAEPTPAAAPDHHEAPAAAKPGDADGDGTPDADEKPAAGATAGDADGDGTPDAEEVHPSKPGDADGDGVADALEDSDGDGTPDGKEDSDGDGVSDADEAVASADVDPNAKDSDGDGTPDAQEDGDIDNDGIKDSEEEDPPTDPFDADGDGVIEPDEVADRAAFAAYFDDIPNQPNDAALEARPEATELKGTIDIETFRTGVRLVKKIVLAKMAKKMALKSDQRMKKFSMLVSGFSLLGLLLLLMPLVLAKKYPGQGKNLLKYSALAAATFVVTVNLFGGVLYGLRTVQGALSSYTNPSVAIAAGTFDALDENADKYLAMGRELFMPTIEQIRNHPEEQPAAQFLENGIKIVQDAKVFLTMAKMFKKVDFVFSILPIVLTLVTLILFMLAIRPTLTEIIKLPAMAASGRSGVGKEVVANSLRRVKGELLASLCTIGVLVVLTLISAVVLGQIVKPALDAFLQYFSLTIAYLQFAEGASSGLVFLTLFAVMLFLILNLAALILSMSFFLGKSQKIFQQKFNEGTPISTHLRFFKWGAPAVLLVQVFPLLFAMVASTLLDKINDSVMGTELNADSISWGKMLLAGPAVLVVAFLVLFWALRGIKAIKFLAGYKVKPKAQPATPAPAADA